MTEEQAGAKICPYTQMGCFGSACMFWRWTDQEREVVFGKTNPFPPERNAYIYKQNGNWIEWRTKGTDGYCGKINPPD